MNLGSRIRTLRKERGLKQYQLARLIGIAAPSLSSIEKGNTLSLRESTMLNLCRVLGTNPAYLRTGKGERGPMTVVSHDKAQINALWDGLDEASRATLLATAQALADRQARTTSVEEPAGTPYQPKAV